MRSRALFVLWGMLGAFGSEVFARSETPEHFIAFFDPKVIWESVPAFQAPKKELEDVLNRLQQRYSGLEKVLRDEGNLLQKERVRLEELSSKQERKADFPKQEECMKSFEKKWNAFNEKVLKIQKVVEDKKRCIGEVYEQANDSLQKLLQTTIEDLSRKKGIQIILMKEGIAYAIPSLNLTVELVETLKEKPNPALLTFEQCERRGDE